MTKFLTGVIVGIVISTVGFSGIARLADRGVQTIQNQTKELAQ
jgi:hypothetical protein